jgi:hypothetical protein
MVNNELEVTWKEVAMVYFNPSMPASVQGTDILSASVRCTLVKALKESDNLTPSVYWI